MEIKPLITEKATGEAASGRYTFRVPRTATKSQIKEAVQRIFKVKVTTVTTAVIPGKSYRVGKRRNLRTKADWKKTVVSLVKGQKIELWP